MMNWREPWEASKLHQTATFALAGSLGLLLLSPAWITCWNRWHALVVLEDKMRDQQQMTRSLTSQAEQFERTMPTSSFTRINPQTLMAFASLSALQFSRANQDTQAPTQHLTARKAHLVPMHFDLQGSWSGWFSWLAQWPRAAPGVTLSSLTMKANPQGGLDVQMMALAAQINDVGVAKQATPLKSVMEEPMGDLLDARRWEQMKNHHMQAHPSYAKQVAPELLRVQEPLERYAREHLQYVGQISSVGDVQGLIRIHAPAGAKFSEIHRVRVGSHAGQNFGRVSRIDVDHLVIDELMRDPSGAWQRQKARLPLQEGPP